MLWKNGKDAPDFNRVWCGGGLGHKVPRKEAVKKYKDAVRRITRRNLPINLEMVIVKHNPIIVREAFLIVYKV